jgi:hypothetical protein
MKQATALSVALATLVLAHVAHAQTYSMNTTYAGGNGQNGAMFDLAATGGIPLKIISFDINTASTVQWAVYVVTANTSYAGLDTNAAAWTLLATTPVIPGAGTGLHTPLNLNLNYSIPGNGQKVGFYVAGVTTTTLTYTNGTVVNALHTSDGTLSFYEGIGKALPHFSGIFTPRIFNGTIHYQHDRNILSLTQSGPGVGDATLSIGSLSPTGGESWLLVSTNLATPVGMGPIIGLTPDAATFNVFSLPYFPGHVFHFNGQDAGMWPQLPFSVPPGSVNNLAGLTVDVAFVMLTLGGAYDSRSNVVRYTFQ